MNENEITAFKNELRNYRFYQNKVKELKEEIDLIYYNLTGVKGVSFDRQPSGTSIELKNDKLYNQYHKLDNIDKKIKLYESRIESIEQTLNMLDEEVRSIVIGIYADNKTYRELSQTIHLSKSAIHYEINKHLKMI